MRSNFPAWVILSCFSKKVAHAFLSRDPRTARSELVQDFEIFDNPGPVQSFYFPGSWPGLLGRLLTGFGSWVPYLYTRLIYILEND